MCWLLFLNYQQHTSNSNDSSATTFNDDDDDNDENTKNDKQIAGRHEQRRSRRDLRLLSEFETSSCDSEQDFEAENELFVSCPLELVVDEKGSHSLLPNQQQQRRLRRRSHCSLDLFACDQLDSPPFDSRRAHFEENCQVGVSSMIISGQDGQVCRECSLVGNYASSGLMLGWPSELQSVDQEEGVTHSDQPTFWPLVELHENPFNQWPPTTTTTTTPTTAAQANKRRQSEREEEEEEEDKQAQIEQSLWSTSVIDENSRVEVECERKEEKEVELEEEREREEEKERQVEATLQRSRLLSLSFEQREKRAAIRLVSKSRSRSRRSRSERKRSERDKLQCCAGRVTRALCVC